MNDIEEILTEWEKDAQIDRTQPGRASLEIPKLHAKYLRVLMTNKLRLKKVEDDFLILRKTMHNYYNGNFNTDKDKLNELGLEPFRMVLKSDINIYIESDPNIIKLNSKKTYYKEMVTACELILGELAKRTYQIKNHIEYEKFINGS